MGGCALKFVSLLISFCLPLCLSLRLLQVAESWFTVEKRYPIPGKSKQPEVESDDERITFRTEQNSPDPYEDEETFLSQLLFEKECLDFCGDMPAKTKEAKMICEKVVMLQKELNWTGLEEIPEKIQVEGMRKTLNFITGSVSNHFTTLLTISTVRLLLTKLVQYRKNALLARETLERIDELVLVCRKRSALRKNPGPS